MKTLKEFIDYLDTNGYVVDEEGMPYEFFNDELRSVLFVNKKINRYVTLSCHYPDDLIEDLVREYSEPGSEYCFMDDKITSRIIVDAALIESNVVNASDFFDGKKRGIILSDENEDEFMNLSDYYRHRLNMFEKCIWIQNNELEHSVRIMKQHFANVAFFNENIKPILEPDYHLNYDSLLDILEHDTSDPTFIWLLDDTYDAYEIWFHTDCITGDFVATVPFGTYDGKLIRFEDLANSFNRDEFVEAVNLSKAHGKKTMELYLKDRELNPIFNEEN